MRIGRLTAYLQNILDACIAMEDVIFYIALDDYRHNSTVLRPSNFDVAINNFWWL